MHRVMVVEDEIAVGRSLERLLRRWGAQVHVVADPLDEGSFEQMLVDHQPTIVMSDLLLHAALDGVQVLTVARRVLPAARRALLSGSLFMVDQATRQSIEPCVFLEKPWDVSDLRARLGFTKDGVE